MTAAPAGLARRAQRIRRHIVDMCGAGGHLGGSLSLTEILTTLYFAVLDIDPRAPEHPGRDIMILSKGHGAIALYATLAERGFFPTEELAGFGRPGLVETLRGTGYRLGSAG